MCIVSESDKIYICVYSDSFKGTRCDISCPFDVLYRSRDLRLYRRVAHLRSPKRACWTCSGWTVRSNRARLVARRRGERVGPLSRCLATHGVLFGGARLGFARNTQERPERDGSDSNSFGRCHDLTRRNRGDRCLVPFVVSGCRRFGRDIAIQLALRGRIAGLKHAGDSLSQHRNCLRIQASDVDTAVADHVNSVVFA